MYLSIILFVVIIITIIWYQKTKKNTYGLGRTIHGLICIFLIGSCSIAICIISIIALSSDTPYKAFHIIMILLNIVPAGILSYGIYRMIVDKSDDGN